MTSIFYYSFFKIKSSFHIAAKQRTVKPTFCYSIPKLFNRELLKKLSEYSCSI